MGKHVGPGIVLVSLALIVLLPLLAIAATDPAPTAASPAGAAKAASVLDVSFDAGLLSVKAEGVDLATLLGKVAAASGVEIEVGKDVAGKATIAFEGVALEEGIKRILEAANAGGCAAAFDKPADAKPGEFSLRKVSVVRKGTGEAPAAAASGGGAANVKASDFPRTVEGVKEYLRAKYGKDVGIEWVMWDDIGDQQKITRIAFYEPGISKQVSLANIRQFSESKLREFAYFLQLDLYQMGDVKPGETSDEIGISSRQLVNGVPVEATGAGVTVGRSSGGVSAIDLIKVGSNFRPNIIVPTEPKVTQHEAEEIARKKVEPMRSLSAKVLGGPAALLIRPQEIPGRSAKPEGYTYHLAWKVEYGDYMVYVDALTGDVFHYYSTLADEIVEGRLKGFRYGALSGSSYVDDYQAYEDGLGGLYIWKDGQNRDLPPPLPAIVTSTVEGMSKGTFSVESTTDLPVYSHLQTQWYRIYKNDLTSFLMWEPSQPDGSDLNFSPFDGEANGHQANIHHQLQRGYSWLMSDGITGNEPPAGLKVYSAVGDLGSGVFGSTLNGNKEIKLAVKGAQSSDTILHELTHAAVFTLHQDSIGETTSQRGVYEGAANFFPCRVNKDQVDQPPPGYEENDLGDGSEKVEDWNGDGKVTDLDFQHYRNGYAIASILWDLTKESTPNHATEAKVWAALQPPGDGSDRGGIDGFSPEKFYEALKGKMVDPSLLWTAFSFHGVNLWANPLPGGAIALDWFPHYGPEYAGYNVYRNTTDSFDDSMTPIATTLSATSWTDLSVPTGTKYYYRVRPRTSGGGVGPFSNTAFETGQDNQPPAAPGSFGGAVVPDGQKKKVHLIWSLAGDTDLSGYVIEQAGEPFPASSVDTYFIPATEGGSYLDDNGGSGWMEDQRYYYRIKVVDLSGLSSGWTLMSPEYLVPGEKTIPGKPADLKVRTGNGEARVSWTAPTTNADGTPLGDLKEYGVGPSFSMRGKPAT